ncbi:hypothetical protein CALCODRAFT_505370 [Calocera cornea HHB12733]|uniref:Uncharacterized protein n=1 Tax=Calocera cornea HHB12733 TaxID=1353952 RepID=A0A165K2K2_9BASI|nr:hypothetical protein CALCODRAFT_505370 [Calocera cornea HHB12733]
MERSTGPWTLSDGGSVFLGVKRDPTIGLDELFGRAHTGVAARQDDSGLVPGSYFVNWRRADTGEDHLAERIDVLHPAIMVKRDEDSALDKPYLGFESPWKRTDTGGEHLAEAIGVFQPAIMVERADGLGFDEVHQGPEAADGGPLERAPCPYNYHIDRRAEPDIGYCPWDITYARSAGSDPSYGSWNVAPERSLEREYGQRDVPDKVEVVEWVEFRSEEELE